MCGACGTPTIRPPWEVVLAGDRPAHRRRRAAAAARATGGRVKVTPWGAAGYLLTPRTGPISTCPTLDALALALLKHLSNPLPACGPCHHPAEQRLVCLPADTDLQRLAVWSALATARPGAAPLTVDIHAPGPQDPYSDTAHPVCSDHHRIHVLRTAATRPSVLLRGPHGPRHEALLRCYLGADDLQDRRTTAQLAEQRSRSMDEQDPVPR
ncbi:hypothetical protein [Streptomyces collinus]|uniref:hypothetical protein n=1 Tax=Streptomyces collinus TaxID=42684 RepID=UPI00331F31C8